MNDHLTQTTLPPRRQKHKKSKSKWRTGKRKSPLHAKKKQSLIFKERPKNEQPNTKKQKENKKKRSKETNPFILIRIITTLFIIMVVSTLTYISWLWFN